MDKITETEALLDEYKLKKTKLRKQILAVFLAQHKALSYADLIAHIDTSIDKSTVYRNLAKLEEKGLIHPVENTTGVLKYALGSHSEKDEHQHAHFQCTQCQSVFCIPKAEINLGSIPTGFQVKSASLNVKGVCGKCKLSTEN